MFNILFAPREYLDPGSGSFLVQILIATFVGAAFAIRLMWGKITSVFRRDSGNTPEPADPDEDQADLQ